MKRDDIIRMARETGLERIVYTLPNGASDWVVPDYERLERFAALVAAAEREECAQIVEREASQYAEPVWAFEIVNDIRARGQERPASTPESSTNSVASR